MSPFFDAHNHLHDTWLAPHRDRVFADLAANGVRACVVNGTNETDWPDVAAFCSSALRSAALSSQPSALSSGGSAITLIPSFGLHPWDVGNRTADWQHHLLRQLDQNPHAALGEIGLDRWMLDRARPDDPRLAGLRRAPLDEQIEVFRGQLALAAERNLPTSIHCLDAFGPLLDVLRSMPLPPRGFLLHAYSGSAEMAAAYAKLGAYFSFNGGFLESRKERLRELYASASIPADRLLIETDAPAMRLPPDRERFTLPDSPDRQPVNHPANLVVTYTALAELRGLSLESLTAQVAQNFEKLFTVSV